MSMVFSEILFLINTVFIINKEFGIKIQKITQKIDGKNASFCHFNATNNFKIPHKQV